MATLAGAQNARSSLSGVARAWVFVGLLLAGLGGFLLGTQRSDVMELEGRTVGVGENVATIEAGGFSYGVSHSVAWIDAKGVFNEDGWPDCLGSPGNSATVDFGAVPVPALGTRTVVYVDCRP